MTFTWDPQKAGGNPKKHRVDFREAATVFDGTLSMMFPDEGHSVGERRFLIIGVSARGRMLVVSHTEVAGDTIRIISARSATPHERTFYEKTTLARTEELRPEYDFASMKGGVRGKYARRAREGTNIVLIQPEVAEAFPTERAVNEALKGMLNTARAVRNTGGLPNTYQPSPRQERRSSPSGRRVTKTRDRKK